MVVDRDKKNMASDGACNSFVMTSLNMRGHTLFETTLSGKTGTLAIQVEITSYIISYNYKSGKVIGLYKYSFNHNLIKPEELSYLSKEGFSGVIVLQILI